MVTNGENLVEWYNPSAPLLSGRAQISLDVGFVKIVQDRFKALFTEAIDFETFDQVGPNGEGNPLLIDICLPTIFGIAKNTDTAATEKHFMGTIRLNMKGSRRIVAANFIDIIKYMKGIAQDQDRRFSKNSWGIFFYI